MSLSLKLGLRLAAILAGALSLFVWSGQRGFVSESARQAEERVLSAWGRTAEACAVYWGRPGWCEGALLGAAQTVEPAALLEAMVLDSSSRVLLHTDFFRGDSRLRGVKATAAETILAARADGPLRQEAAPGPAGRRVYSTPVSDPTERLGTLVAVYSAARLDAAQDWLKAEARRRQVLALLLGGGAGILGALGLAQSLLAPLQGLVDGARRVSSGDFKHRIPEKGESELAYLAREFNRMTQKLGELDELKDAFVAQVTHDLRGPLSGIVGQSDLLLGGYKGALTAQQQEALETLNRCAAELTKLIDAILDAASLEAGAVRLQRSPVDVVDAVAGVVALFEPRAKEQDVLLETHLQPDLAVVEADPDAFRRVLTNLLSNALKFTPAGGHVAVSARRGAPKEAVFSVSDGGPGIPPEKLPSLFKKFSQIDENKKHLRGHAGTGLGLAICRELVQAHGGRIWAENAPGGGARFTFTLPT